MKSSDSRCISCRVVRRGQVLPLLLQVAVLLVQLMPNVVNAQLFGEGILGAVNILKTNMQDNFNIASRLFPPTLLEVELEDFENPNYPGSRGILPLLNKVFTNLLLTTVPTVPVGGNICTDTNENENTNENTEEITEFSEFLEALPDFFNLISRNSCEVNAQLAPSLFFKERFGQPIVDFFQALRLDTPFLKDGRRLLEQVEEKQQQQQLLQKRRQLQTPSSNLQCVSRLEEGSLNGTLPRLPNIESESFFAGLAGQNQYAWGHEFTNDLGFGVIVHSLGAPGALTGRFSTPTFTVRNRQGTIVFQGVLFNPVPNDEEVNQGIRAATITAVDFTESGDTIFTVIGAIVGSPRGEFQEFKFSQAEFEANNRQPVLEQRPTRIFNFESQSVRSLEQVSPTLIFYAPSLDLSGFQEASFFRFFDLTTWSNVGPRIFPTNSAITDGSDARLKGLIWDFECSFDDNGLCFLNTIETDLGDEELFFDETNVPTTSYFESIPFDLASQPLSNNTELLPVTVVPNTFDIPYSAQSLEPISAKSTVVCTLSGFLFRGGSITLSPDSAEPDPAVTDTLTDFQGILRFLELGEPQQCDVCTGVSSASRERRSLQQNQRDLRRKSHRLGSRRLNGKGDSGKGGGKGDSGKGGGKGGRDDNDENAFDFLPENTCQRIAIENQPSTTAYIWAVEECGGKTFVGTYDIASVFGEVLLDTFLGVVSLVACGNPVTIALACALNPGQCTADLGLNENVCQTSLNRAINDALPSTLRTVFATTLASIIFEEPVGPNDIGFDLYVADTDDILAGDATFRPVTQNGFRELAPARFESDPDFVAAFGFEPSSQNDEAIRSMSCAKNPDGSDSLIIGSAVFRIDSSSNTFALDTDCLDAVEA